MSEENVEIVRRYLEEQASVALPLKQLPAWAAGFWESDGDYCPARGLPDVRPCHGREEIVRFGAELIPTWTEYRYVVKDARAIGDDRVFAHAELHAAGRASGVALEGETYHCCWLRYGRFIRAEDHLTEKGALHALGLSGETLEGAGLTE
jgi:hypothetical protein